MGSGRPAPASRSRRRTRRRRCPGGDPPWVIERSLPASSQCCPKAKRCVDPFHVIQLGTEALDEIRREVWRGAGQAGQAGQADVAAELKGTRNALWKSPENLTARQQAKLADVERLNRPLYRAYLPKEQMRQIYRLPVRAAIALIEDWLQWARRCRLKLPARSPSSERGSWRRFATASPTHGWRRSTPRSG